MFNTHRLTAQIANLNLRIEKHGTERVLAADLKLAMKIGSDDLNDIEPEDGSELLELLQREDCLATLTAPKLAAQEPQPEDLAA